MKVRVLKKFQDKYTGELHKKDDEIDVNEERYSEIMEKGDLVELIKDEKEENATKPVKKTSNKTKR